MTLTPEQFNQITTKTEFKELKDETSEIKTDIKTILTAVDGLAQNVKDIEHVFVSSMAAHDRFEKRISKIEQHLNLSPYKFFVKK